MTFLKENVREKNIENCRQGTADVVKCNRHEFQTQVVARNHEREENGEWNDLFDRVQLKRFCLGQFHPENVREIVAEIRCDDANHGSDKTLEPCHEKCSVKLHLRATEQFLVYEYCRYRNCPENKTWKFHKNKQIATKIFTNKRRRLKVSEDIS